MRIGKVTMLVLMAAALILLPAVTAFSTGSREMDDTDGGPITVEIRSVLPGEDWLLSETAIGQKIIEETGVDINLTHSIGEVDEAIALIVASGDMPDVVAPQYKPGPFIDAGEAMEITELVETHAPNMIEAYGPMWNRMRYTPEDPGRYYHGDYYVDEYPINDPYPGNWFFLQHEVVIDQGFPEIRTFDDMTNAIRTYVEKYPTIDGQPTLGMSFDMQIWVLNLHNPAYISAGIIADSDFKTYEDGTAVMHRRLPEHRPFYEWLNELYNEGLLDPETFTQTKDQFDAKAASGRVLSYLGMGWQIGQAEQVLFSEGMPERTFGAYPVAAPGATHNFGYPPPSIQTPQAEMVLSADMDPDKAVAFTQLLDFVASPEGYVLANWGVEGEHYDVVDGTRVWNPEIRERELSDPSFRFDTGLGLLTGGLFPGYGEGTKDPSGNYWSPSYVDDAGSNYPDIDRQVLDGYGFDTWRDLFLAAVPEERTTERAPRTQYLITSLPGDHPARIAFTTMRDIAQRDLVAAIIAPTSQFDEKYDLYLQHLEDAGIYELEETATQLARERMEFWDLDGEQ